MPELLLWIIGSVGLLCYFRRGDAAERNARNRTRQIQQFLSSPYHEDLVNDFKLHARNLEPSDMYISDVERVADKIIELLTRRGDVKLVRAKIAGSIGKGTGISYTTQSGRKVNPDLDLVVFLDDVEPPFKEYLKFFAEILNDLDEVSDIIVRKYSVQFQFWTQFHGDIKVDLLAAANYVNNSHPWRKEDVGEVEALVAMMGLNVKQRESIVNTQNVSQEENKVFSSSLAEKTVQVIRDIVDQDEFVLEVVRLAKHWNSRVNLTKYGYVPARSCIMEEIAIISQPESIARNEEDERCLISGFRRFLENVSKFSTLDISLNKNMQKVPLENYTKPRIMDPVNNWNNLAAGIPAGAIKVWEEQAKMTLLLLEDWRNNKVYVENAIDEIFCHKAGNNNDNNKQSDDTI